jgi:ribosomal protein L13
MLYFAWAVRAKHKEKQEEAAKGEDPIEEIREAFRDMFPKDSLRAKERRKRLALLQRRRRRKFPK